MKTNFDNLFWFIYIIWVLIQIWIGRKDKLLSKNVEATGSKSTYVIIVGILAGIFIAFEVSHLLPSPIDHYSYLIQWIGIGIAVLGLIIHVTAIYTLGKFFKTVIIIQDKHELIPVGLYKYFRHPSYFAGMVILLGMGLMLNNWVAFFIILIIPFLTFIYRISTEEKVLIQKFGQQYLDYKKKTWAILPFIW